MGKSFVRLHFGHPVASIDKPDDYLRYRAHKKTVLKELKIHSTVKEETLESYLEAEKVILTESYGRMARGGHGLPKKLLGPAMANLSTTCGQPYNRFRGDHLQGRPSSTPLHTPCHMPMLRS
jgi:hypothetical protein